MPQLLDQAQTVELARRVLLRLRRLGLLQQWQALGRRLLRRRNRQVAR